MSGKPIIVRYGLKGLTGEKEEFHVNCKVRDEKDAKTLERILEENGSTTTRRVTTHSWTAYTVKLALGAVRSGDTEEER